MVQGRGSPAAQPKPRKSWTRACVYLSLSLPLALLFSPSLSLVYVCVHMLLEYLCDFYKKIAKKLHAQLPDNSFYQSWQLVFLAIFSFCSWIVSQICLLCSFIYIVALNYLWSDETWVCATKQFIWQITRTCTVINGFEELKENRYLSFRFSYEIRYKVAWKTAE